MSPPSFLDGCAPATPALSRDHRNRPSVFSAPQRWTAPAVPDRLRACRVCRSASRARRCCLSPSQSFKSPYPQIRAPFLLDPSLSLPLLLRSLSLRHRFCQLFPPNPALPQQTAPQRTPVPVSLLPERLLSRRPPEAASRAVSGSSAAGPAKPSRPLLPSKVRRIRCTHLCACL